jgi:hypothetical protein
MKIAAARACAPASVLVLALATWLYFPGAARSIKRAEPGLRVCVYDASSSAVSRTGDWETWLASMLLAEAASASAAHEDLCVVGFAGEVKRLYGPGPPDDFADRALAASTHFGASARASIEGLRLRSDESRFAAALDLARELLAHRPSDRSRVRLFVDGTYTGVDPRTELELLRGAGVSVEWIAMPAATAPDVAIARLIAGERIEAGAPLSVACDVLLRRGEHAVADLDPRLHVRCLAPSASFDRDLSLDIPPGLSTDEDGYSAWRVRCDLGRAEPGLTRIEASVSARGDAVPEDDSVTAAIVCGEKILAGWIGGDGPDAEPPPWLRGIESAGGVQVVTLSASDVARRREIRSIGLAREIGSLDVLVTGDVAYERLPSELVAAFVERGGGWLSLAGFESWRGFLRSGSRDRANPSGENESRLLALLPLEPLDREPPGREVLFLIDGSGSMVGEPFDRARAAILPLLALSSARDSVGVALFSASLGETRSLLAPDETGSRVEPLDAARAAVEDLSAPGGPTALLGSLEELAARRSASRDTALVILLSDGRDVSTPSPGARCRDIAQRLAAARTRLCVVAVGDDPDLELLGALVPDGRRLLVERTLSSAESARELRDLFEREASADRLRDGADIAVLPASALAERAGALGADVLQAELRAAKTPWPAIRRCVRARGKDGASVLWTSGEGDPLLALQRAGLGACAASAFAIPEWAPAWGERADLLGPLVRALGRNKRERGPRAAIVGDELRLEELATDFPPALEASVFPADEPVSAASAARIAHAVLTPPISGADPRTLRAGALVLERAAEPDARALRVEVRRRGAGASEPALLELPLALERAPEFRFPRQRVSRAETEDRSSGARPRSIADREQSGPHAAAPPLLALGLLLLAVGAVSGGFARRAG